MPIAAHPITIDGAIYDKIGTDWSISVLPSGKVATSLRMRWYRTVEGGIEHAPVDPVLTLASADVFGGQFAFVSASPLARTDQLGIILECLGDVDAALQKATDRLNFNG